MIKRFLIILLLLLPGYTWAGSCGGFVAFAGYGLDYGPTDYKKEKDFNYQRYRDRNQIVYGLEYNWEYFRSQFMHSSSADNGNRASFGDMSQANILFKIDF